MSFPEKEILGLAAREEETGESNKYARGSAFLRERLGIVASKAATTSPGNLVEIGCHVGKSTVVLAAVARDHGRRLVCVDPWQKGTQNCRGGEYGEFLARVRESGLFDYVDVIRDSSLDPDVVATLKDTPICFAFVDGLHTYAAASSDVRSVGHCVGPVVVDDVSWNAGVMRAFLEGAEALSRDPFSHEWLREGYLL